MAKPFDYSKWDKIELSDDEEDVHPNIDKDSWFRWKHNARIEREAKEAKEKQELEEKNSLARAQKEEILSRLRALQEKGEAGSDADEASLKAELEEVEKGLKERLDRLDEMEKNRKLNVDNIGTVVKDYTSINRRETKDVHPDKLISSKPAPTTGSSSTDNKKAAAAAAPPIPAPTPSVSGPSVKPPSASSSGSSKAETASSSSSQAPPEAPSVPSELEQAENYNSFVTTHEALLERFSELRTLEETREMLHEQGYILLADHSQSYLLLSCLEDEMNGKHERMKHTARQSQVLSHITELATSLGRSPRDVVMPFFHRLESPEHLNGFLEAVKDFIKKIEKRAVEKHKEMAAARARGEDVDGYEEVEVPREERLGPGGLDPVEVFESLPEALQEAFASQDMEKLHKALSDLPIEEAKKHMKACADSGLWVPGGGGEGEEA